MRTVLIILTFVFYSCSKVEKGPINVIDLFSTPEAEITKLSDIAEDVEYIALQTLESSLIKRITSLKVEGNYFYIGSSDRVLCFNNSGRFLFTLDKRGIGPGEYQYMQEFDINLNNTILAVRSASNIFLYKQTGNGFIFIDKLTVSTSPGKINFNGNSSNLLLQYSNRDGTKQYSMELINLEGEVISIWPNNMMFTLKDGMVSAIYYENISYRLNNMLYLKELMNDTLFKLTEDETLEPFLIFDTKDKRLTPEARSNGIYLANHGYEYFQVQKIFASERYVYYSYAFNKNYGHVIYDQESKEKYSVPDKIFLKDDLTGGLNFEPQYCKDGIFYTWVEAFTLKQYVSGEDFKKSDMKTPKKKKALEELANSLDETDNPILIAVKVK